MANRLELTQAYHKVSSSTLEQAAEAARASFLSLGSWREDDIPRYIEQVVPAMNNAKRNMANYAVNYYKQVSDLAGEQFKIPRITAADLSTQALRNGVTDEVIWSRPFKTMWTRLSKGDDFTDALNAGARRAVDLARTDVELARRGAGLQARNANDRIVGYIRTLSGSENCALCYVASTQRYKKKDLLPIHPGCDCGEMPIYGTQDPGQVIDEITLDATHEAVTDRFGVADRGARDVGLGKTYRAKDGTLVQADFTAITIRDHGELGPVLTVKGDKFTKLKPERKAPKIKAPTPVAPKPFVARLQPKLSKINAATVADDIRAEHGDVFVPNLKGKAKVQKLGEKTKGYLAAVKEVGRDIDLEINSRVKVALDELADPREIAFAQTQIKSAEELLAKTKIEYEAGLQKQIIVERAKIEAQAQKRVAELRADDFNEEYIANYLERFYSQEKILREAAAMANQTFKFTPVGQKLVREIDGYVKDLEEYKKVLPANIVPGTERYNQVYAAKAKEVLSEFRDLGNGGPKLIGATRASEILEEARQVYPSDWLAKAAEKYENLGVRDVSRGYFNNFTGEIAISYNKTNGFKGGYATAVHELGHMFEYSVPGLKELEFAFAHERAALSPKRTNLGGKEVGFQDSWRNLYTGKDYGYNVDSAYEIFTTGVESVFGGSNHFNIPVHKSLSKYYNSELGPNATSDDEFRQFVLGVLFAL